MFFRRRRQKASNNEIFENLNKTIELVDALVRQEEGAGRAAGSRAHADLVIPPPDARFQRAAAVPK
jgi:hypothetical protein